MLACWQRPKQKNIVIFVQYCKVWPVLIIREHKTNFQSAKVTFITGKLLSKKKYSHVLTTLRTLYAPCCTSSKFGEK
jgi:hypothetical protein